ncbi:prephenate dehydratase [Zhihengliuella flava]|uniref:Prephenate dehydratase n=1 Tax=Zhihengliuella flava TaxID=1285193 RepID=A0A931DA22_9MICC|nr:prephenate dehydratase [Zhihengliuella flava]MBG6084778.1 prephenate dehydratase [Zhihengliuella flava]
MIYTYLGPAGTFTESALLQIPGAADAERVPATSVNDALERVRDGAADAAMVPIENSVEGGVSATLDAIATGGALQIVAEALVPITFDLVVREGIESPAQIRIVATHGHAWAQCRGWSELNMPEAEFIPAASTAAGALAVLDPESGVDAGICSPLVAQEQPVTVLRRGVEDNTGAVTRFVLVRRPGSLPAPSGRDKTTVVIPLPEDRPGGLMEILEQFAARGVNLSRIESRPTGAGLGNYFFSVDTHGHIDEARMADALAGLHRISPDLRFLGSYPAAGEALIDVPSPARHNTDEAFAAAHEWIESLRRGG